MSTIKLFSASKNVRCFPPYTESPRTLSIQLTDGRTLYLRAKKDLDLERWFFVLSKIWSLQQLINSPHNHQEMADVAPSGCTRAVSAVGALSERGDAKAHARSVPARQQSMQLIQKYLSQRRQHRRVPQHDEPQHLKPSPPEPTCQPLDQDSTSSRYRLIPLPTLNATEAQETQENYQIPAPARLSRFLPTGFEWDMEDSTKPRRQVMEGDGDDREKLTPTARDGPKFRAKSPPVQTHPASPFWDTNSGTNVKDPQDMAPHTTCDYLDIRAVEIPVPRQPRKEERPVFWPAMTTLAPEKAAAIDAWRRSLLSPLMMGDEASYQSDDAENQAPGRKGRPSQGDDNTCATFESPIPGRTQDKSDTFPSWVHQKDECNRSPLTGTGSERVSYEAVHLPMPGQSGANRPKTMLFPSGREEVETYFPTQRRASFDMIANQLSISQQNFAGKDASEELPLGLIKLNRHSRWQKTQLSSEDGASAANRNSFPTLDALDALLPPAPITPKQMPRELHPLENSLSMANKLSKEGSNERVTTLSNPTLSLHGSSYSHLPIHDPEFMYPRHGQHGQHPMSSNRRPSCPQLNLYPLRHSLDHAQHSTHPLVSFTRSPPNSAHTPVDNKFPSPHSMPNLMMRRESSPLPGGQSMQEGLARYYEQKQQQQQSWLQWQQDDDEEEEEEEEEDDDEEENEPLAQTRERRQQSIQYQQSILQAQMARAMPVAPQVVEVPMMMTSVQVAKKASQVQESIPLLVVPPPQVQAVQVQELEEPSDEEETQDDDVETPATSDDEEMDEFCYF
ncbi:hypothetical protein BGZ81_005851 [Podila clonocystis]|nr:hypothetical protein BGZ81_005851 [Podila clonocystis]